MDLSGSAKTIQTLRCSRQTRPRPRVPTRRDRRSPSMCQPPFGQQHRKGDSMNSSTNPIYRDRFSQFDNSRLRWLPFVILLTTAVVLWLMWDRVPERWPIHYGLNGQPNGWAAKTPFGVFLPVGFGLLMCGFFELLIKFNLA